MKRFTAFTILLFSHFLFADSSSVRGISFTTNQSGCKIIFVTEGKPQYKSSFFDNPPRIVLNFPATKNRLNKKALQPTANSCFQGIRFSEDKDNAQKIKILQIIIDLKSKVDYALSPREDGFIVSLTPRVAHVEQPKQPNVVSEPLRIDIGPEDLLEITVFELPQFNVTTRVSGDGTITMPLVGSIEVRGLTKKETEKKIEAALVAKYVNNASVSVNIKEYKSKQVSFLGAIRSPGPYYISSPRNLLQLIVEAGGLTPDAGRKCYIFRSGSPKIEIDLTNLITNGDEKLNIPILPGDVINIPPASRVMVYILGAVKSPGLVDLSTDSEVTLLAAIAKAGGLSDQANKSGVQIRRKDGDGKETLLKVNVKDILSGKIPDIPLMAGDIINIPQSFF